MYTGNYIAQAIDDSELFKEGEIEFASCELCLDSHRLDNMTEFEDYLYMCPKCLHVEEDGYWMQLVIRIYRLKIILGKAEQKLRKISNTNVKDFGMDYFKKQTELLKCENMIKRLKNYINNLKELEAKC